MKRFLLPETGRFFKANLHCHTTLSDGSMTPQQVKKEYAARGYSIVAFTDHERFFRHNNLTDGRFLALNGYEIDISQKDVANSYFTKCYHFNAYALDEGEREPVLPKPAYGDMAGVNTFIKTLNANGFIVCYNHPYWSLQTLDDYRGLKGIFACEIFNFGAYNLDGIDGNQTQVYDTLLRMGNRIGCVAADDNHNRSPFGHPLNDSFGGWVMVKAENLDYKTIMAALQNGDYYASSGPAIESLSIENDTVSISCSEAVRITCTTAGRHGQAANAVGSGRLTHAKFEIDPSDVYIRLEVVDAQGARANSRAYFLDEWKAD
ncbi:MAG TPA: CehA/McbA family metallohydrolase [Clostridiales bacterium]|nr:MAG: hypothetical protein BWY37_01744 [Firmicutes bacterium ADurb.Bin262]HOU10780.1 CehA/McbA family metallohydrolase [Clostridiales bacterium]HQK73666.1 CehA/McbA family metallohydrolase [Clostridiales bacterium]